MREKLLVLAKAAPEASKKYAELVCVAGITDKGEWRRIYPIPWEIFWKNKDTKFKKKQWIEYKLVSNEPSDHRKESRKIITESIVVLGDANYMDIEKILNQKLTTLKELDNDKTASLGVIKPIVTDYIPITNKQYEKILNMAKQRTLYGDKVYKLDPPKHKYQYVFTENNNLIQHKILCEDWESVMLYFNCNKRYPIEIVHEKVKEKMLSLANLERSFFIIGTHYRFKTNIIIGVVYPKKNDV